MTLTGLCHLSVLVAGSTKETAWYSTVSQQPCFGFHQFSQSWYGKNSPSPSL